MKAGMSIPTGQPPMQYLTGWRMQLAAARLRETDAKVLEIGTGSGYQAAVLAEIARVLHACKTKSLPVYLEIPMDMAERPVNPVPTVEPSPCDPEAAATAPALALE